MISCRRASEWTEDELEGRLGWGQRLQLQLHRFLCPMCRVYQRQVLKLRAFFRGQAWEEQLPVLSAQARENIARRVSLELTGKGEV